MLSTALAGGSEHGVHAATVRLERDGSGDFTILQDALDAAAAGDTILIGPGRYDDFTIETFLGGGTGATIGNIHVDSLTIIGESAKTVFIGPEEMTSDHLGYAAFGLLADNSESYGWSIRNVTLENTRNAMVLYGDTEATDCVFRSDADGAARLYFRHDGKKVEFRDCVFGTSSGSGVGRVEALEGSINRGPSELVIDGCIFDGAGFNLSSIDSLLIIDTSMTDGLATLFYVSGRLTRFTARNSRSAAIGTDSASLLIEDSSFQGGGGASTAAFLTNSTIECVGTVFQQPLLPAGGSWEASVLLAAVHSFSADNCDLLPGSTYTLYAATASTQAPEFDLTNCFWGTTDSLAIESLIFDRADEDHPDYPSTYDLTRVRFWPPREGSVLSETGSVGGLKGRFRRGGSSGQE
jgi:hypothetical protein